MNNVLYFSSINISSDETYKLSRIVMSEAGNVITTDRLHFPDTGFGGFSGFLPEFAVFSEDDERRIVFVDGVSFKMYKGKFDEAGRVVNCQCLTNLTNGFIKDVGFSRNQYYKISAMIFVLESIDKVFQWGTFTTNKRLNPKQIFNLVIWFSKMVHYQVIF